MDDVSGGQKPNPNDTGAATPGGTPNPTTGTVTPNLEEKLNAALEQIETLKRQYNGSSQEAIRLKEELSQATKTLTELQTSKGSTPTNDEEFNERVSQVGLAQAIKELISGATNDVATKLERLEKKDTDVIINSFKEKHPGLTGDVVVKFDQEFSRLKNVYPSVEEAMEAAYRVIGGDVADEQARSKTAPVASDNRNAAQQSDREKEEAARAAAGGNGDRSPAPVNVTADLEKQVSDLTARAMEKEAGNRDATDLWAKIEDIKFEIRRKKG